MRDKQIPGDTYNHKEHVYADPVALLKEIERDKQEEEAKRKKAAEEEEAKLRAATPPPVPSGPRKGTSGSIMYAELGKKTNLPGVRDLGSRFGGTVSRPSRRQSEDDPAPPPVPAVTDSRNILDSDSPPVSPSEVIRKEGFPSSGSPQSVPNNDMNIPTEDENKQRQISNDGNANIAIPEDEALALNNTEVKITEQPGSTPNVCVIKSEVVIDVTINSETGFDIGAEIPGLRENETSDENCGIKLVKNVPWDAFTTEESSETVRSAEKPVLALDTGSAANKAEQGSVAGSAAGSTTSSKTRKKKDVESGIGSVGHQRRNLIIIALFLLILLILISAVVIFLLAQSWSQN